MTFKPDIQVVKRDHLGKEVFRYPGKILTMDAVHITLRAEFNFELVQIEEITLRRGDMFIETYYFDRWYNIFEIHQGTSDRIKAYYCNIGYPAVLIDGEVSYRDLALDLFVRPDGRETLLDMDEFETLELDGATRQRALNGLDQLRAQISDFLQAI
jgi:protein associated with RNAse G/E